MMKAIDLSRHVETVFLFVSCVWAVYVVSESLAFESLLPKILPVASALLLLVFIGIRFYTMFLRDDVYDITEDDSKTFEKTATRNEFLLCFVLIIGYAVLSLTIGFFFAMPIFLIAFFAVYDLYSPSRLALVTVLTWLAICILFGVVFGITTVDLGPFTEINLF